MMKFKEFLREVEAAEPLIGEDGKKKKKKRIEGGSALPPVGKGNPPPSKYNTTGSSGDVPYAI